MEGFPESEIAQRSGKAGCHRRLRGRSWRSRTFVTRTMPLGRREAGLASVNDATGTGYNGRLRPNWRVPPTGFAISCQIPSHGKHSPSGRPVFAVSSHNLLVAPPIMAVTRTSSIPVASEDVLETELQLTHGSRRGDHAECPWCADVPPGWIPVRMIRKVEGFEAKLKRLAFGDRSVLC